MSFNVALSGIAAAQTDLDSTANNIANVGTVGFKESRAEFDSVYANSLFSNSKTKTGDGVSVAAVAQQFHQGSLKFTNNPLDLAITGSGFFATSGNIGDRDLSFTRAGTFKLNNENFIVDNSGNYLQAFPVNPDGTSSSVSLSTTQPIQIPETAGTPVSTSEISITLNLPAGDSTLDPANFDPNDPSTYNNATSVTIYDSLGEAHITSTYYIKPDDASFTGTNQWVTFVTVDGKPVDAWDKNATPPAPVSGTYGQDTTGDGLQDTTAQATYTDANGVVRTGAVLTFDSVGAYTGSSPAALDFAPLGVGGANVLDPGADGTQAFNLDFKEPTQFASAFEVTALEQDGLTVGRLTGVEIGNDGLVKATYSNGTSQPLSRVAIVRFRNEQGLAQTGSNWIASQNSGEPIAGEASSGSFGSINSAALEQSNVNLTTELVDLITAQRNFQANSRALEINNTLQQTILQIR
ncbi:flagellar hook protein FlgE [Psychromonas sp. psych-6C06]|uniref:flagellar hook protein FlgE n=1 Tax=Psychromonas sp. psych-6C06 TaxID=2058089 RepID=UPI000C326E66|nr:flagellar hook protein FlgE [Psychromonas sp. psych-6C06]PKF62767.1 flagellar hook protein FlgE [Psychromonas sp. psych-6C06]